jgi:hypothetical protein
MIERSGLLQILSAADGNQRIYSLKRPLFPFPLQTDKYDIQGRTSGKPPHNRMYIPFMPTG